MQKITSKKTALNQIPKIHKYILKNNLINENEIVLDYGCGYGLGRTIFKNRVDNYDPYNDWNEKQEIIYDSVICANVLNVIDDLETVKEIIKELFRISNKIFICIYEGNKSNIGCVTTKGYQRNEKTEKYIELIKEIIKCDYSIKKKENMIFISKI